MVRVFLAGFLAFSVLLSQRAFSLTEEDCPCSQGPDVKGIFEITEYLSPYVTQKEREAKIEKDLEHYRHHENQRPHVSVSPERHNAPIAQVSP